jgi:hypothetical protein
LVAPRFELDDLESQRIHRAVRGSLQMGASQSVISKAPSNWRRRIAPALGAAATLALIVVGGAQVIGGGNGGSPSVASKQDAKDAGQRSSGGQGASTTSAPDTLGSSGSGAESGDQNTVIQTSAVPVRFIGSLGKTTPEKLRRLARQNATFKNLAEKASGASYDSGRVLLDKLAGTAPSDAVARDVRECATSIMTQGVDYDYLPAFGALATLEGQPTLIIGFNYAVSGEAKLDRFQLWGWRRPGCDNVIYYSRGPIRP